MFMQCYVFHIHLTIRYNAVESYHSSWGINVHGSLVYYPRINIHMNMFIFLLILINIVTFALLCRLPVLAEATYIGITLVVRRWCHKIFCHVFLRNHAYSQLPNTWHRASVWTTVSCNAVSNLPHVNFLFDAT